jgi:hypothetical protein
MSPYYIKEVIFINGILKITIADANDETKTWEISPCADELLNRFTNPTSV